VNERAAHHSVRWYHVAILAVAVLVCAAGVGFASTQSSDRADATTERDRARVAVVAQLHRTAASATELDETRADTKTALEAVAPVTATSPA